jgi:Flp pilus assembly protein TadB
MSAAERRDGPGRGGPPGIPVTAPNEKLRERRRAAQRRKHLARVDVGLGLLAALIIVVAAPGLAITALIVLIMLIAVGIAYLVERQLRARRRRRPGGEPPAAALDVRGGSERD